MTAATVAAAARRIRCADAIYSLHGPWPRGARTLISPARKPGGSETARRRGDMLSTPGWPGRAVVLHTTAIRAAPPPYPRPVSCQRIARAADGRVMTEGDLIWLAPWAAFAAGVTAVVFWLRRTRQSARRTPPPRSRARQSGPGSPGPAGVPPNGLGAIEVERGIMVRLGRAGRVASLGATLSGKPGERPVRAESRFRAFLAAMLVPAWARCCTGCPASRW